MMMAPGILFLPPIDLRIILTVLLGLNRHPKLFCRYNDNQNEVIILR